MRLSPLLPHGGRCAACRGQPPPFARLVALADYRHQPAVRPWILALKYGGRADLAQVLARPLSELVRAENAALGERDPFLCVPVPLHRWRRWQRGYDQAARLAAGLAVELDGRAANVLERARATAPQGAPGARSRSANVRAAFRLRRAWLGAARGPRLEGRAVWLVDDVVTSGATVAACARLLRRAGARRVLVACLARGGGPDPPDPSTPARGGALGPVGLRPGARAE